MDETRKLKLLNCLTARGCQSRLLAFADWLHARDGGEPCSRAWRHGCLGIAGVENGDSRIAQALSGKELSAATPSDAILGRKSALKPIPPAQPAEPPQSPFAALKRLKEPG